MFGFIKEYDIEHINKQWWILEDGRGIIHSKKWAKCQSFLNKLKKGQPFNGEPPEFLFSQILNLDDEGEVY